MGLLVGCNSIVNSQRLRWSPVPNGDSDGKASISEPSKAVLVCLHRQTEGIAEDLAQKGVQRQRQAGRLADMTFDGGSFQQVARVCQKSMRIR